MCVCVCERERERERECACVCVCVCVRACVRTRGYMCVSKLGWEPIFDDKFVYANVLFFSFCFLFFFFSSFFFLPLFNLSMKCTRLRLI